MKYLDPKADLTFKRVFGENKEIVISFLNAMLPLADDELIEQVEYLSSEMLPEAPWRKYSIVDVRCKDMQGRQFSVEMQMLWSPEFKQRVLFNASKTYVRQLDKGVNYELLQPVYSLNLVNEVFEPDLSEYYHYYRMVHELHTDRIIDGLHLIFVELPKFKPQSLNDKKMQVLWLRYLTEINSQTQVISPDLLTNPIINKAVEELRESAFTPEEIRGYDKFWDMVSVEVTLHCNAIKRGRAEGIEQGRAEGFEQGRAKGIEQERYTIVRQMIAKGLSDDLIAELTGLGAEEISRLRDESR